MGVRRWPWTAGGSVRGLDAVGCHRRGACGHLLLEALARTAKAAKYLRETGILGDVH
jgi:hypothetical protein